MTLDNAMPLINAAGQLITQLMLQIMQSVHMSEEDKNTALALLTNHLDKTVEEVKNVRFDAKPKAVP